MSKTYRMGILGCGDYLRWRWRSISRSERVEVTALYDLERSRAEDYAARLGGRAVGSDADVLEASDVDIVCLFVPPWARRELLLRAAAAGKHILATKPLAPGVQECADMVRAVEGNVRCGVEYRRVEDAFIETCKRIFDGGELGRLALYRQEWLHHYPTWNEWATDPDKNGGPFMDAMIHNQNTVRYLMGRPATHCTFTSETLAHPDLRCADTESMVLDFEGGSAHLFITWAADLEVFSTEGNDREHIEFFYMVTHRGWRITDESTDDGRRIVACREGERREFEPQAPARTVYDRFVEAVENDAPLPRDLPGIREAYEDVKILRDGERRPGQRHPVDLALA
ncbi:MAG: Gfo/Idh/MocA family oxidoreductase [Candidatus Brocadiia bacterium]